MGKKGKKTRWRELPITLGDKPYTAPDHPHQQSGRHATDARPVNFAAAAGRRGGGGGSTHHHLHQQPYRVGGGNYGVSNVGSQSNSTSTTTTTSTTTVTFNEEEYTKITTPRQDVLFKKGYLGRRKNASVPVINEVANENEDVLNADAIGQGEEMCPSDEYVDPSAMYIINGGGYEVYDPYTGNVTVVMGPAPGHYPPAGHPMMATMPYQPMPIQPVEWFNPANIQPHLGNEPWTPGVYQSHRHNKKHASADAQQNCSAQSSEEGSSVHELGSDDQQHALYQPAQPYVYPGYMFGAPLYNYNGMSIQMPLPQSPPSPSISCDYTNSKRRKKKKRRKRGGTTEEYSDSSSEEQKSQSGASSDLILDSEKTSDSGVLTNNSGGSTPVNVIPVQLSHNAAPFHMECSPQPFEILHGPPILVHHHADPMAAFYHPIPQYTDHLTPIGYQAIPEEPMPIEPSTDDRPNGEPTAGYSAENSDSGISSPNSEVMVKESEEGKHVKTQAANDGTGQTTTTTTSTKKNRNKKTKQRQTAGDKAVQSAAAKTKKKESQKTHHEGGKKSSKIAMEPPIIKMLNAKKAKSKSDPDKDGGKCSAGKGEPKPAVTKTEVVAAEIGQLSINPTSDWVQDEEFCSLECTPRSLADDHRFEFAKTRSVDSCDSVEEETFATAVNTGYSDTENEIGCRQEDAVPAVKTDDDTETVPTRAAATVPGPITEAVTKWLNDQGGLKLVVPPSSCLQDDDDTEITTDDEADSEYDDFEEQPMSPKNVPSNPCPFAPSPSGGKGTGVAAVVAAGANEPTPQQPNGGMLPNGGICCLTQ
ncbi:uncharacterized protein LOC126834085 [Adelges cooleyi]|uniref:uncharacterized protein LOC126834085 n=1 Tax=Adelges cooleyi TaxID=133065 RepID=UPI00217FB6C7|nr:uncharacterized protein LOC126834085 [Adelges cooleyi]